MMLNWSENTGSEKYPAHESEGKRYKTAMSTFQLPELQSERTHRSL